VFETVDLGDMPWRSQMMLLTGIALLIWVMFRRNIRAKRIQHQQNAEVRTQKKKWAARESSGAPLADAPVDVARWQSGMFDLQRELRAELDSKIAVVQSLVRMADARIETLKQLSSERLETTLPQRAARVEQLTREGRTASEIAAAMGISVGDAEFLQGLRISN
jgi:hypothetical protein